MAPISQDTDRFADFIALSLREFSRFLLDSASISHINANDLLYVVLNTISESTSKCECESVCRAFAVGVWDSQNIMSYLLAFPGMW